MFWGTFKTDASKQKKWFDICFLQFRGWKNNHNFFNPESKTTSSAIKLEISLPTCCGYSWQLFKVCAYRQTFFCLFELVLSSAWELSEDWCVRSDSGILELLQLWQTYTEARKWRWEAAGFLKTYTDTLHFQNCARRNEQPGDGCKLCFPTPVEVSRGVTKSDGRGYDLDFGHLCQKVFLPGLTSNSFIY